MKNETYIIGIANSEANGAHIEKVFGSEKDVKKYLSKMIREDKKNNIDSWDMGSTNARDLAVESDGTIQGYNIFNDCHIDYTAIPERLVKTLILE